MYSDFLINEIDFFFKSYWHQQLCQSAFTVLTVLQIKLYPLSFLKGTNPKKPSAPDMFTESDDMFAAYFDVSTPPVALIPLRCLDSDHHDLCQCVFNFFFFFKWSCLWNRILSDRVAKSGVRVSGRPCIITVQTRVCQRVTLDRATAFSLVTFLWGDWELLVRFESR